MSFLLYLFPPSLKQSNSPIVPVFYWLCLLLLTFPNSQIQAGEPNNTPILRIEPNLHTAAIGRMAVDKAERFVVTASDDKTARVWDIKTGKLLQILRPPIAQGHEGKLYAVAISPNGEQIAVAGWTGYAWDRTTSIYLFKRTTGELVQRIQGLPNITNHLSYSTNGKVLAAALGGRNGIRFYTTSSQDGNYQQIAQDSNYDSRSNCIDFDQQGRSVTTSDDGFIRLYDAQFNKLLQKKTTGGKQPFFARFSPNGKRIAIGFNDSTAIEMVLTDNLTPLSLPKTKDFNNGDLSKVAWSKNGTWLYAGGRYDNDKGNPIITWNSQSFTKSRIYHVAQSTLMDIHPLADGGLLFASADPALGRLDAKGKILWKQGAGKLDYLGSTARRKFSLADNALSVGFHYQYENQQGEMEQKIAQWNIDKLSFNNAANNKELNPPILSTPKLIIQNWEGEVHPSLNNSPLQLEEHETSRSLAISPAIGKIKPVFALGTEWAVRLYNHQGKLQWKQAVPTTWAVSISADNRYVVAALDDGTIRWYQLKDGKERLAFYLHPDAIKDKPRWIAWTPEGFYATSSADAESLIGFHINQGADKAARFVSASQLHEVFAREDLIALALSDKYSPLAAKALQKAGDIQQILSAGLAPRIQLLGKHKITLKQREFELQFKLQDQGGGIGKLEYRVDGKLISSSGTRAYPPRSGGQGGFRHTFTLGHGQHTISIAAYNKAGLVASKPVEIEVIVNDPVHREPSLYVISIGISNYRDRGFNLKYAADDAIDFAATLKKRGRKLYKKVETKVLVDQEATLAEIGAAFETIARKAQPQDVFAFYLAGHGTVSDGRYQFIPYELIFENEEALRKQALNENKLKELIASVETGKRMMVMDSCHAAKAIPLLSSIAATTLSSRNMVDKGAINRLMNATGIAILAATSKDAKEGIIENGQGHGVFTHVLLKGLRGAAEGNKKDGQIDIEELISYSRSEVPRISMEKWNYEQFPMYQSPRQNFPISLIK